MADHSKDHLLRLTTPTTTTTTVITEVAPKVRFFAFDCDERFYSKIAKNKMYITELIVFYWIYYRINSRSVSLIYFCAQICYLPKSHFDASVRSQRQLQQLRPAKQNLLVTTRISRAAIQKSTRKTSHCEQMEQQATSSIQRLEQNLSLEAARARGKLTMNTCGLP
jgi:hypothetical protein